MKFYTIYPSLDCNRDFSFDLKGNQNRVLDYFKFSDVNSGFLKNSRINLTYDEVFNNEVVDILKLDFYFSSSGILLFSKRFYDACKDKLKLDCEFIPCLINGNLSEIYALYIKNKTNILDESGNILKNDKVASVYIFRDKSMPYIYMVTDRFINIVEENKFKMQFLEYK